MLKRRAFRGASVCAGQAAASADAEMLAQHLADAIVGVAIMAGAVFLAALPAGRSGLAELGEYHADARPLDAPVVTLLAVATPNGINDLTPNPTVSHGCATVDGIAPKGDRRHARAALQWGMNADADTIASLEHVQSLQTLLLRAILAELPPPARVRVLARFTAAAERLPVADDDADAVGAAFCVALLGDRSD